MDPRAYNDNCETEFNFTDADVVSAIGSGMFEPMGAEDIVNKQAWAATTQYASRKAMFKAVCNGVKVPSCEAEAPLCLQLNLTKCKWELPAIRGRNKQTGELIRAPVKRRRERSCSPDLTKWRGIQRRFENNLNRAVEEQRKLEVFNLQPASTSRKGLAKLADQKARVEFVNNRKDAITINSGILKREKPKSSFFREDQQAQDLTGYELDEFLNDDPDLEPLDNWTDNSKWAMQYDDQKRLECDEVFEIEDDSPVLCQLLPVKASTPIPSTGSDDTQTISEIWDDGEGVELIGVDCGEREGLVAWADLVAEDLKERYRQKQSEVVKQRDRLRAAHEAVNKMKATILKVSSKNWKYDEACERENRLNQLQQWLNERKAKFSKACRELEAIRSAMND